MGDTTDIALKSNDFFRNIFNKVSSNIIILINAIIFIQCDKDKDGFITVAELYQLIETREYEEDIPEYVVERIHNMHDNNKDKKLDFDEFYQMMNNPDLQYIFGHYMNR